MEHLHTSNLDLKENGWELLVNEKGELPQPKIGDIVKIVIVTVSPLDYEEELIRSVSHEALWAEIEKREVNGYIGRLKTKPGHTLKIKDGTKFQIGDTIFFRGENILAIR